VKTTARKTVVVLEKRVGGGGESEGEAYDRPWNLQNWRIHSFVRTERQYLFTCPHCDKVGDKMTRAGTGCTRGLVVFFYQADQVILAHIPRYRSKLRHPTKLLPVD
ncbi:unnamed protein product, partial [Laminaria digitata]